LTRIDQSQLTFNQPSS